jgi:hypothetical protein
MKGEKAQPRSFIPLRHSSKGQMAPVRTELRNLDIFNIAPDVIPPQEQVNEVWFTFNLLLNYVFNKNLRPGGRPEKLITWVETAQKAYPSNPYMTLFRALGHSILGQVAEAENLRGRAAELSQTDYWRERFTSFGLDGLLANFPVGAEAVYAHMEKLGQDIARSFDHWLGESAGDIRDRASAILHIREAVSEARRHPNVVNRPEPLSAAE